MQAATMLDYVRERVYEAESRELTAAEEESVYEEAVALLVRDNVVLIRSNPGNMERMFAADDVLRGLAPKERVQFTGSHLPEVRRELRRRGECWRMSPRPRSGREISSYVRNSRCTVGTGTVFYHDAHTGGRFLTYQEFLKIRPLIRENPAEAFARLL